MAERAAGNNVPPAIVAPTRLESQMTDTNRYKVPVVTLSKENDKKLLKQLKSGFKRTVKWSKYRSQMTIESNNSNLNYLIDPTFTKVNSCLFCPLKELKKPMLKKIREILFHIIMYQSSKKRFQSSNRLKKFL